MWWLVYEMSCKVQRNSIQVKRCWHCTHTQHNNYFFVLHTKTCHKHTYRRTHTHGDRKRHVNGANKKRRVSSIFAQRCPKFKSHSQTTHYCQLITHDWWLMSYDMVMFELQKCSHYLLRGAAAGMQTHGRITPISLAENSVCESHNDMVSVWKVT